MRRTLVGVLITIASLLVVCAPSLFAETVQVTIGVGDTILKVSGKTSPNAFVTISKDGNVIGTAVADNAGIYEQIFTAQEPGLHQLQLYAHTTGGANTDTISLTVSITEHATTVVDVFLPSTLEVEDTTLEHGQSLVLTGEALPNSTVSLYIDNTIYTSTSTDSLGRWSITMPTSSLMVGQHDVFVRVTDSLGSQSHPTVARHFTLAGAAETISPNPQKFIPRIPVPGITFPKPSAPSTPSQEPLRIHVQNPTVTIYEGEAVTLRALVLNSRPPYDIAVEWVNGHPTFLTSTSNELAFERMYTETGKYVVIAIVQDAQGRKNTIYFTIEVLPREPNTSPDFTLFIIILCILLGLYLSRKHTKSQKEKD